MNNIDSIEKALEQFPQQRIISAWIEGDYAHGLAAKDNKPSLCVITMPQPLLDAQSRTYHGLAVRWLAYPFQPASGASDNPPLHGGRGIP